MNNFKPGDKVIRKLPKLKGTIYFCLKFGDIGVVVEQIDDQVYLEDFGDWPHHEATLQLANFALVKTTTPWNLIE